MTGFPSQKPRSSREANSPTLFYLYKREKRQQDFSIIVFSPKGDNWLPPTLLHVTQNGHLYLSDVYKL